MQEITSDQELVTITDNIDDTYLIFLQRLCDLHLPLIPQLRYEEICDQTTATSLASTLLLASTDSREIVTQLYRDGVTDWSVLAGIYANLNILVTRSKKIAEQVAKHPMTTRMRYWSPQCGFVFWFRDINRQRIDFLTQDDMRARAAIERIIAGGKKEVSITKEKQQVRLTLPALSITMGQIGGESFCVYQGEAAAFDLPTPAELAQCKGLEAALRLARSDWQVFDAKILQGAVTETTF